MTWSRVRTVSAPPIVAMHRCPFLVVVVCMLPGAKSRSACLNMFLSNMYLEVLPGHSSSVRSECEEVFKGGLGVCKFSSVFSITDGRRCASRHLSIRKLTRVTSVSRLTSYSIFERPAQIKGMEEGMHSMRVGGKRRVIMPQGLGYTVQGLGPYPADPRKRDVLVQVNTYHHLSRLLCGTARDSIAPTSATRTRSRDSDVCVSTHLTQTINQHPARGRYSSTGRQAVLVTYRGCPQSWCIPTISGSRINLARTVLVHFAYLWA